MENAIKILILEHDPNDLELLQYALKKSELHYIYKVVQTQVEFEKTLINFKPDIILSDFSLPSFNGFSAFLIKEKLLPETPFLIVSGTIGDENAVELIRNGVTDYVLKEKLYQIGPKITRALNEVQARKQKEETACQLQQREEQLQKILNLSLDVIYTVDPDGNFVTVNPAAKLILDYQPEELIGRNILDFIHEEDKPRTSTAFANLRYGIDIINHETRYLRKSGIPVTLLWSVRWHSDETGYGVAKDITEIKKVEHALKYREKQLEEAYEHTNNILESISEGFFAVDKNWNVTYWNKVAEQLLIIPKENILNKNLWDVFRGAIDSDSYVAYHRAMAEQITITFQDYFPPLDRWYEINVSPSKEGLTAFFKDITEIKNAQEKIKNNEQRFRSLLQNSNDGFTLLAKDGSVMERSASALKILELSPEEVGGNFRIDLVHPDDVKALHKACKAVKRTPGAMKTIEYRMLMPRGNYKWIESTLNNQLNVPAVKAIVLNFRDITARKLVEIALKKSELILKKGEGIAHMGTWQVDFTTGKAYWSDESYRLFGLMPGEVEPTIEEYFSFVHPEDLPAVKSSMETSDIKTKSNRIFHRIIRKDGEIRHVLNEAKIEFDPGTKETMLFGVLLDVTEQKIAEKKLKHSESRLNQAQAIGKIGNWEVNFIKKSSEWSEEIYRIFGVEKGKIIPSSDLFISFIHPEDKESVINKVRNSQASLDNDSVNFRFFRANGELCFGYSEWRFESDNQGNAISIFGIMQDITDKKLAELALEQSEEKYRSIFQLSPLPMWVFDVETYRFLNVNEAATRHYGYSKEEFLNMTIKDIRPEEDLEILEETIRLNKKTGNFYQSIANHTKKDGEIIQVEIQSNMVDYESKKARLVLARDISERLKYMRAIEEQNKKLREIAWIQSHVVRAPLARIMGLISLLKDKPQKEENFPELVSYLTNSANELDSVIRNIIKETENVEKEILE